MAYRIWRSGESGAVYSYIAQQAEGVVTLDLDRSGGPPVDEVLIHPEADPYTSAELAAARALGRAEAERLRSLCAELDLAIRSARHYIGLCGELDSAWRIAHRSWSHVLWSTLRGGL